MIEENGETCDALTIPEDTELLENQVAGHRFGECFVGFVLLRHSVSKDVLKPIIDKRSERELQLYSDIFNADNDCDPIVVHLRQFVPKFNGIFTDEKSGKSFLRLKDITIDFANPSILDVKIGPKTYDLEANEEKIKSEINKYPFAQQIGFRILGMRVRILNILVFSVLVSL